MSDANLLALYTHTDIEARFHLLELQRNPNHGRDVAWAFWKFATNARIVEVLAQHTWTIPEPDWALLRWRLGELKIACHPLNFGNHSPRSSAVIAGTPPVASHSAAGVSLSPVGENSTNTKTKNKSSWQL